MSPRWKLVLAIHEAAGMWLLGSYAGWMLSSQLTDTVLASPEAKQAVPAAIGFCFGTATAAGVFWLAARDVLMPGREDAGEPADHDAAEAADFRDDWPGLED